MSARNAFLFPQISFTNKRLWVSYRDPLRKVNTWMKLCFCGCIVQIKPTFSYSTSGSGKVWDKQLLYVEIHADSDLTWGTETHSIEFSRGAGVCWHSRPQPSLCQLKVKNSQLNSFHRKYNSQTLNKMIINTASRLLLPLLVLELNW